MTTRSRSRTGWALAGFLAIAAFLLFSEHRAHLFGLLPFLLLLACPLLHMFGHGGHGRGHDGHAGGRQQPPSTMHAAHSRGDEAPDRRAP